MAADSPKNRPTATPAPRPARILWVNVKKALLLRPSIEQLLHRVPNQLVALGVVVLPVDLSACCAAPDGTGIVDDVDDQRALFDDAHRGGLSAAGRNVDIKIRG